MCAVAVSGLVSTGSHEFVLAIQEQDMGFAGGVNGTHKIITIDVPGRSQARMLCLVQRDSTGADYYYVLAECESRAIRWRSMVRDNAVHRLRDEFVPCIVNEEEIDDFDVESIFFCTTEVSKA